MARVLVASAFVTLVLAVLTALMYNVPEFEDFRSKSVFLGGAQPVAFEAIAQGFYKLQIDWHMSPFHHENLDLYLLSEGTSWYLSDAGGFDSWLDPHASKIAAAVQAVIPPGQNLTYIILTHGHIDHVGAIEPLIALYPDLRIIFHEKEAPFLEGTANPSCYDYVSPSLSASYRLLQLLRLMPPFAQYKVPANRSLILEGPKGDLAKFGVHSLSFTHTPGHCRGHVVYHHKPTGYMLAGDFADVLRSDKDGSYSFKTMCADSCNITEAHETVCRIVHDMDYKLLLPYHDARKTGWTKDELVPLAKAYSQCS